jgi:signal transduction histidine kinase
MFVWSLQILFEPITYLGAVYLMYILSKKMDMPFPGKLTLGIIFLPLIIFSPTRYFLPAFDISSCLSVETIWSYYTYVIETIAIIWIAIFAIREYRKRTSFKERGQILFMSIGLILFLLAFASGNIIGSLTGDWNVAQIGLIGAPLLMGFLSYAVSRFQAFNVKLLSTEILVLILWIVLCSVLFVQNIEIARVIVSFTLIVFIIAGILLVKSVSREVEQRERIEKLLEKLEIANMRLKELDQMKSEFLSLATHQIRSPLTAIKGYASMLLDGDYGELPKEAKNSVNIIMRSCQNLVNIVNDFLNISRIEQGRMVYDKSVFNIGDLVSEVINQYKPNLEDAKLSLSVNIPESPIPIEADKDKLKQIVGNIVDNAIKYTKKGEVRVSVSESGKEVVIEVKDTGIGIEPFEIENLFMKFFRTREAHRKNISGSGLGLYIARKIAEAHGGTIEAHSEGIGKGSTFKIILPKLNTRFAGI